jgi:ribosome maturation factor RimP
VNRRQIEKMVADITMPIVEKFNYDLVDVEFVKEGPDYFLRIFIDKPNGITIDDCQKVSKMISEKLDDLDPIDRSYYLEVSSPGIDRPLKNDRDLKKNVGKEVEIKLYAPLDGKKIYVGNLKDFNDEQIKIETEEKSEFIIPKEKISKINLAFRL